VGIISYNNSLALLKGFGIEQINSLHFICWFESYCNYNGWCYIDAVYKLSGTIKLNLMKKMSLDNAVTLLAILNCFSTEEIIENHMDVLR
jgi:hypothetical protein